MGYVEPVITKAKNLAIEESIIAVVCDAVEFPEIFSEQVNK